MLRHRSKRPLLVALGQRAELSARLGRGWDIADGEHDLHVRGKQLRPLASFGSLNQGPADPRCGGVDFPLDRPQQGQTWLWLPAAPACLLVRLLSLTEIPEQPMDLASPVASL